MNTAQTAPVLPSSTASQNAEIAVLREQIQSLKAQLEWFKRQLFGAKSEKRLIVDSATQTDLLASLQATPTEEPTPALETVTYQRCKPRRDNSVTDQGLRFDDRVPVETIDLPPSPAWAEVPEADRIQISEKITYRLAQRPGSYVVLKYVRPVLKHPDTQELFTTPAPNNVLERSVADVSFLAGMLVDKFLYHLPLYRQHLRLKQNGIDLSRATLTNLAGRAIDLMIPIFDAQFEHILKSRVLAMDETPVKAGRKSKGKMRQGYLWPVYGEADEIAFHYTATHEAAHVASILGEQFEGVLLSDGFDAYERYASQRASVVHAECWAHTRRYFERAQTSDPQAAGDALAIIGELYRHEAHIQKKQLTGKSKLTYRTQHSEPVVYAFWQWCETQCQRHDLLPSDPMTKALNYARTRTERLRVFLSDPDVPIDTNHLERALRPIPMGRRSWLFCWTELGAKQVGVIQSLMVTCKLHEIDPYLYLVDVLQRISQHPASRVIELTPRLWKKQFADNPLRSDLDRPPDV